MWVALEVGDGGGVAARVDIEAAMCDSAACDSGRKQLSFKMLDEDSVTSRSSSTKEEEFAGNGRRPRKTSKVHFEEVEGARPPPERKGPAHMHYSWTSVEELQKRRSAKEAMRARLLPAHMRRSDEDVAEEARSNALSRTCSHVVMPLCIAGSLISAAAVVSFHSVAGILPADVAILLLIGAFLGGGFLAMLASAVAQTWYVAPYGEPRTNLQRLPRAPAASHGAACPWRYALAPAPVRSMLPRGRCRAGYHSPLP